MSYPTVRQQRHREHTEHTERLARLDRIEQKLAAGGLSDRELDALELEWVAEMKAAGEDLKAVAEREIHTLPPHEQVELISQIERMAGLMRSIAGTSPGVAFEPAGEAVIDRRGVVLDDDGPGAPSAKAAAAIQTTTYKSAFRDYLRKGLSRIGHSDIKALQEGVDEHGGFLVPADIANRIVARSAAPTRLAGMVSRIPTSRDRLIVPKVNYSADDIYSTGVRVTWTGEVPSSSTVHRVTDPEFGQVPIGIYTAMMSTTATLDMVEDAAFPVLTWLAERFGETYRLVLEEQIIRGTGIGRPSGLLLDPDGTDQPATVKSGSASALTPDGLLDLTWSIPEQYDENCAWVFNKTNTGAAIAKLKDAENRYLWAQFEQSGLVLPARERALLGYPVAFSSFMPNVGAGTFPAIFGDLSGYFLVERVGLSVQVLREKHAEENEVGILGRVRFGGQVVEPWKLRVQKVAS